VVKNHTKKDYTGWLRIIPKSELNTKNRITKFEAASFLELRYIFGTVKTIMMILIMYKMHHPKADR
jgi:hypothetical protein